MMKAKRHTFFPPALTLMVLCSVPAFSVRAGLDFSAGANDIGYGANVSGAVSDKLYYNLGGGTVLSQPPGRSNLQRLGMSMGWNSDLMCGNFDIKTTVGNQLNGVTAGFKNLMSEVIQNATGAVASIPCRPDLRQVRFEVQHSNIKNPALAAALQDFTDDCYSRALYDWKAKDQGKTQDEKTLQDITWIGSATFMKGEYHQIQSRTPRAGFPWDADRDDGYANVNGNGYPTCYQWWNDANAGLLKLVKEQTDEGMWLRARAAMKLINKNSKEFEEAIVRRLVSPANLDVSGGRVYRGYGGNADMTVMNELARMGGVAGTSLASLGAFPAFDTMRQSLPMVQGLMLMAVYIMIPMVLMFSAYEFKTAITVTLSLIHISEPTRPPVASRMPSSA